MITAPETNIKLTDEHLAQIQEGENRLSNIESLTTIANRNLKTAKLELERTTKDILLQTEKLTALTSQVDAKNKELESVTASHSETSVKLSTLNNEIETKTATHSAKETELANRESKVVSDEKKLAEHTNVVEQLTSERLAEENIFNAKVAKLKEVISTF